MKKVALIVAGGKGERMNADTPKQFLLLNGTPILIHTLKKFYHFDKIVLVLPELQFQSWQELCKSYNVMQEHTLVSGGVTRFHSVKNGLDAIDENTIIAIHDGVRPIISNSLINDLLTKTKSKIGVIPIVPIKDTIRKIDGEKSVLVDRSNLYKVQTPQCFLSTDIKNAYTQDFSDTFTDDASVFEGNGRKIKTILGEEKNIKITTKEDMNIASILIL